jgi:hypothetical protein
MTPRSWLRKWLRLPSGTALMFGIGAISAIGASVERASALTSRPLRVPQQSTKQFGELRIWSENGRIYLREQDGAVQEVALSDTPEARQLRSLLEESGAVESRPQVIQDRIVLVGGGGQSVDWRGDGRSDRRGATSPDSQAGGRNGDSPRRAPSQSNARANPDVSGDRRKD